MNAPSRDTLPVAPPPRTALTVAEAAASFGMRETFFREHVLPDLRVIRKGRQRFIAVAELSRYAESEGTLAGATNQRSASG